METVAYHEAGHALMAVSMGAKVLSVTIEPEEDDGPRRSGDTAIEWRMTGLSPREFAERAIRVALAGPVAEMLYTGEPYHPGLVAEWQADWSDAWEHAALVHWDAKPRMAWLEELSIVIYKRFDSEPTWSALADLADNLLAHETLESEVVHGIVREWQL